MRPDRFTPGRHSWQQRGTALRLTPDEGDPVPFLPAQLSPDADALETAATCLTRRRGPGLPAGERDLVAAAVSRRLGCFFTTAGHARRATLGLRRRREVEVLLEEGLPSPLTGRLGAGIAAASALASLPLRPHRQLFWKLEEEKLDDQEITDLILSAGYAAWNARLSLATGEARRLRPGDSPEDAP